jgi:hypothetical protein
MGSTFVHICFPVAGDDAPGNGGFFAWGTCSDDIFDIECVLSVNKESKKKIKSKAKPFRKSTSAAGLIFAVEAPSPCDWAFQCDDIPLGIATLSVTGTTLDGGTAKDAVAFNVASCDGLKSPNRRGGRSRK